MRMSDGKQDDDLYMVEPKLVHNIRLRCTIGIEGRREGTLLPRLCGEINISLLNDVYNLIHLKTISLGYLTLRYDL